MGQRLSYSTVSQNVYMSYYCSKCHVHNIRKVEIAASSFNSSYAGNRSNRDAATNTAKQSLSARLFLIQHGSFRDSDLNGKCQSCGNTEPWSHMHFPDIQSFLLRFIFIAVLIDIMLFSSNVLTGVVFAAIYIALCVVTPKISENYYRKREEKIALLPADSLPVFSLDKDFLQ